MIAVLAAAMLAGCSTSRKAASSQQWQRKPSEQKSTPHTEPVNTPEKITNRDAARVIKEAEGWLGTPYAYGGTDRHGIDCSALVMNVYDKALHISLPRNSSKQYEWCQDKTTVTRDDLLPGDLVFFDTSQTSNGQVNHVAIYTGSGNIIHCSSSRGVTYSDLDSEYFRSRFISGGRVIASNASSSKRKEQALSTLSSSAPPVESAPQPVSPPPPPEPEPQSEPEPPLPIIVASTPQDSRSRVLDNLIETKIDSIHVAQQPGRRS